MRLSDTGLGAARPDRQAAIRPIMPTGYARTKHRYGRSTQRQAEPPGFPALVRPLATRHRSNDFDTGGRFTDADRDEQASGIAVSKVLELALMKAKAAQKRGDLAEAEQLYSRILARFPDNVRAQRDMAALREARETTAAADADPISGLLDLYRAGRLAETIERGGGLAACHPGSFALRDLLGKACNRLGRLAEAADWFREALELRPDGAETCYNLGATLQALGRMDTAIRCYRRCLDIDDGFAAAHNNMGICLQTVDHADEDGQSRLHLAVRHYRRAIGIDPDHAIAHVNLGKALRLLGRTAEAIPLLVRATQISPGLAEAHNVLGTALHAVGRTHEAIDCYRRAIGVRPEYSEAYNNLGVALESLGQREEAIRAYERALEIMPGAGVPRTQKLLQQAHLCDWDAIRGDADWIPALGITGGAVSPFALLPLDDDPARHRARSENFANERFGLLATPPTASPAIRAKGPIRLGYFSADFRDHPVSHCMAGLFELHDRGRFSVHLFSYGADSADPTRARLKAAADVFHDVRGWNDEEIAQRARDQGIDIAIDLMGYTAANRLGILVRRAAPVQIGYLGYPGTLGTGFIDYLVADQVVIPEAMREHYSEKIIYLPDSYMATDASRAIAGPPTRAEMGLPDQGFVFCCFNNSYKISPAEFDIWMRLLGRVEGSVLWLARTHDQAKANLRMEAQRRGIDPSRLVFSDALPMQEHLSRHRLADLFLDTFNYNAHSTASDALWAGLPLVTKAGRGFAARVAASLLTAIGLPELITSTHEDYECLALDLALDSDKLSDVSARLAANRTTMPLFDTAGFARHIETAYARVHSAYVAGLPPGDVMIERSAPSD